MKNNRTKKALSKFSGRNTHKRKSKERAREALMRAINEVGVGTDSLKITTSYDGGRRERSSFKVRRDEILARGVFSSSRSGFGFVTLEEGGERDIFIPEGKTLFAIDGDLVEIIYHKYRSRDGEEKTEGRVKRIIEYGRKTIIGTLELDYVRYGRRYAHERLILIPDDHNISIRPVINDAAGAREGDKVEVLIDRDSSYEISATVVRNFGESTTREANYAAILAECDIPIDFTPAELAEADFFAATPITKEGRHDRTGEIIFTIDGESAKDLDDAVSLRKIPSGWQLGVHIADVSYYVKERTHLDRAVMGRGTSVYFTDKVVPMLPKALSNGACSLNAGEEKYTLSAIINLSPEGDIIHTELEPCVIKSRVRGVYSEVNAIFDGQADSGIKAKYKSVLPTLTKMRELYSVLKKRSQKRGSLELDSAECEILLDENGNPCDIIRRERGEAEMLIEQFMLCANEAVATKLFTEEIPCVYRIHENPPQEKLSDFLTFSHNLGLNIAGISAEAPSPADLSRLLSEAQKRNISAPVSYSMLRAMSKAKYSDVCSRHFGLSIERYAHFTSPIRRLSDLATHRIIRKVLIEGKRPELYSGYARRAAAAATDAELRALSAERRIEDLYKVIYMEKFLGDEFDATISSVTSFGFFAELENTVEGLVPISSLPGVFIFDEKNVTLRSRDVIFKLGDRVRVRLEEADLIRGKLRFSVV